ncbi:Xaa-Pro aminopeptidase I [Reticulomyxa filosa]|uniref:Xaa-Pro aminopeptidase I n=1 Tax=Reticulomyxa filosa TaxID=46433 RepID=X6P6T8_RETFI|nr:Xaa-Pro aminopeptidase I [Reticulomyxa filosa]|eukprot:ETO34260.1 Xaa-Pro aminopeptidase I [Reticulomyxa filosa]
MCIALEPAIYLSDHELIPPPFRNIGIRIEDDILITENEPELLTKKLPRTCDEIEAVMVCYVYDLDTKTKPSLQFFSFVCCVVPKAENKDKMARVKPLYLLHTNDSAETTTECADTVW